MLARYMPRISLFGIEGSKKVLPISSGPQGKNFIWTEPCGGTIIALAACR